MKEFELNDRAGCLFVRYQSPINALQIDCGFSPDYLRLLRNGAGELKPVRTPRIRGWKTPDVAIWLKPVHGVDWEDLEQDSFGHGRLLRMGLRTREGAVALGITRRRSSARSRSASSVGSLVDAWR